MWVEGGWGSNFIPHWFSLSNSQLIKAITLAFCSILQLFIISLDICVKFNISNSSHSPDIWQNSDGGISDFQISGQSLIIENYHNSRSSNGSQDMNLGPVTKLDKRSMKMSKKFDDDVMLTYCDVIVTFPIYGKFGAIQKLDSGLH